MEQHTGLGSTSGQVMEHVQVQRRSLSEMRRTRREGAGVGGCLMFVHHTAYFEASGLLRLRTTAVLAHVLRRVVRGAAGGKFFRVPIRPNGMVFAPILMVIRWDGNGIIHDVMGWDGIRAGC